MQQLCAKPFSVHKTKSLLRTCLGLSLLLILFFAACGTRKSTNTAAARATEALAHVKNKKLYRFINDWMGVPYKLGGLNQKGIDCSGFALLLQKEVYGKKLPRRSIEQAQVVSTKSMSRLREGDLIFFAFGGQAIDHVGIYLNDVFFVHASTTKGVVVDDLNFYQKYIKKTGELK